MGGDKAFHQLNPLVRSFWASRSYQYGQQCAENFVQWHMQDVYFTLYTYELAMVSSTFKQSPLDTRYKFFVNLFYLCYVRPKTKIKI